MFTLKSGLTHFAFFKNTTTISVEKKNDVSRETVIKMTDNGFIPKDIIIQQGNTVTFENVGNNKHWPASNIHPTHQIYHEFDSKHGILSGERWSFTFNKAGEWRMHDHLYPEFSGFIVVNVKKGEKTTSMVEVKRLKNPVVSKNIDIMLLEVNMMKIAKDDNDLRTWLKLAGAKKIMDKVLTDAGGGSVVDCHRESHAVGRIAYELYGPTVFQYGSAACHSGYYHGAMETFLKEKGTQDLSRKIMEICNSFPTSFGVFECLHGVGHGVMAYQDYDLPKSLKVCGTLETSYQQSSCYGGVFMENVVAGQGVGAVKGHDTKWVNRQDPSFPCNAIDQDYTVQYQCYQMQTSWMLTIGGQNFDKVSSECLNIRSDMVSVCYKSLGRDAAGNTLRNPQKIIEICGKVPQKEDYYNQCISGAVNVIIDFWGESLKNQASDLCKLVPRESGKSTCYSVLASRLQDIFRQFSEREAVCSTFEASYRNLCQKS
ncbi:MAG: hypothetical protein HY072_01075 [Deltaproteobacteria bacterium]|nr:hypothetical protein [Deltaproteobacteria bacterium]